MKPLFVLGAWNDEIAMAKKILTLLGYKTTPAMVGDKMAWRNNAHQATGIGYTPEKDQPMVFIECNVMGIKPSLIIQSTPRNPSQDLGTPEFYFGSSCLGKLIANLINNPLIHPGDEGVKIINQTLWEARLSVASEHYVSEAYRGKCPGIDPSSLRLWRAMTRCEKKKETKTTSEILALTNEAMIKLATMKTIEIPGAVIVSVDQDIPELHEAAYIMGVTLLEKIQEKGKPKVRLVNGTPDIVESWAKWAKKNKSYRDVYFSREKVYAGAFLS